MTRGTGVISIASVVLALRLLQPPAAPGGIVPSKSILGLPDPSGRIVITDLSVRLDVASNDFERISVVGMDSSWALVAWATTPPNIAAILRFEARTGELLSKATVPTEYLRRISFAQPALNEEADEILLLQGQTLHAFSLDGALVETIALPFIPTAILVAQGDSVFLGGRRPGFSAPFHILIRSSRLLLSGEPMAPNGSNEVSSVGNGVRLRTGDLWVVDERRYRLERWDTKRFVLNEVLSGNPMIVKYLMGPYEDFRMTGVHLIADRYLWVFMRLKHRTKPDDGFDTAAERFAAEYDGLVEVIDLERSSVVASQYFPQLDLTGWIAGSFGYRENPDGTLELIHCAVEAESTGEVP